MYGLVVDNFAGGGGASTGIAQALGRSVDVAINHDAAALAMHTENHPATLHIRDDVFKVWPRKVTKGRHVSLVWFSPDCTHHSKAKGGKPLNRKKRGLAGIVPLWGEQVTPDILVTENVEEFEDWGPLLRDTGKPDPKRRGQHFRRWVKSLNELGYDVEWQQLVAADFGVPTTRKRLFIIARRDGLPICWPEPTHRNPKLPSDMFSGNLLPWAPASDCIDFNLPCPSIFLSKEEGRRLYGVKRPLAENTLRRVAAGIWRYVIQAQEPFIVPVTHADGPTRGHGVGEPFKTVTGANRGEMALVAPVLTEHANASSPRSFRANEPMRTQCANVKGGHFALIGAHLTKFHGGAVGSDLRNPVPTVTSNSHEKGKSNPGGATPLGLVAAHLSPFYTNGGDGDLNLPAGTITAGGKHHALVSAFLAKHYGGVVGQDLKRPIGAVTAKDHHSLVDAHLAGEEEVEGALRVAAFLITYYGQGIGQPFNRPLRTITVKDRLALVTVIVSGHPLLIHDIGLRMLQPRELALAQGFPIDYALPRAKSEAVRFIGNSVCPPLARAIVEANLGRSGAERVVA